MVSDPTSFTTTATLCLDVACRPSGLSGPQRQFVIPWRKLGRDHDELSGLISNRFDPALPSATRFYDAPGAALQGDSRGARSRSTRTMSKQVLNHRRPTTRRRRKRTPQHLF